MNKNLKEVRLASTSGESLQSEHSRQRESQVSGPEVGPYLVCGKKRKVSMADERK